MNGKSGESSSFTILSSELCDIIKNEFSRLNGKLLWFWAHLLVIQIEM